MVSPLCCHSAFHAQAHIQLQYPGALFYIHPHAQISNIWRTSTSVDLHVWLNPKKTQRKATQTQHIEETSVTLDLCRIITKVQPGFCVRMTHVPPALSERNSFDSFLFHIQQSWFCYNLLLLIWMFLNEHIFAWWRPSKRRVPERLLSFLFIYLCSVYFPWGGEKKSIGSYQWAVVRGRDKDAAAGRVFGCWSQTVEHERSGFGTTNWEEVGFFFFFFFFFSVTMCF